MRTNKSNRRVLGRTLARPVADDELRRVSGGHGGDSACPPGYVLSQPPPYIRPVCDNPDNPHESFGD